jgi:hypothetical protein
MENQKTPPDEFIAEENNLIGRSIMASVHLGKWLSGAMDDPNVCDAMKDDIREWFSAGEPAKVQYARIIAEYQHKLALAREALAQYGNDLCEMGEAHDCCGKLSPVECGGCAAKKTLAQIGETK